MHFWTTILTYVFSSGLEKKLPLGGKMDDLPRVQKK